MNLSFPWGLMLPVTDRVWFPPALGLLPLGSDIRTGERLEESAGMFTGRLDLRRREELHEKVWVMVCPINSQSWVQVHLQPWWSCIQAHREWHRVGRIEGWNRTWDPRHDRANPWVNCAMGPIIGPVWSQGEWYRVPHLRSAAASQRWVKRRNCRT